MNLCRILRTMSPSYAKKGDRNTPPSYADPTVEPRGSVVRSPFPYDDIKDQVIKHISKLCVKFFNGGGRISLNRLAALSEQECWKHVRGTCELGEWCPRRHVGKPGRDPTYKTNKTRRSRNKSCFKTSSLGSLQGNTPSIWCSTKLGTQGLGHESLSSTGRTLKGNGQLCAIQTILAVRRYT